MESYFFKTRKRFDPNPNKYDLIKPFWSFKSHLDMHFLIKIAQVEGTNHLDLYNHHKNHYLENVPEAQEILFFKELFNFVELKKNEEFQKDALKLSPSQKMKSEYKHKKYKSFLEMMQSVDKWGVLKSEDESEKVKELKAEIKRLKIELGKYRVKPEHKIDVIDESKDAILDIFYQLQNLQHWKADEGSNKLMVTFSQHTWAKIFANYFTIKGKEIPFNTAKKYFKKDKIEESTKKGYYNIKLKNKE